MAAGEKSLDVIELLFELEPDAHAAMERNCRWAKYKANETVFDRESPDRDIYFVVRGGVQIVNYSRTGREISFARVMQGGYFGELAAIDGLPRSANAITIEPSLLAAITPELFMDLMSNYWPVTLKILQRFAGMVRYGDDRIMDLSTLKAEKRICAELLRLAKPFPDNPETWLIYPMWTQKEIAARVGVARETVGRVLAQLSSLGIVSRKAKALFIQDHPRLLLMAEDDDPEADEAAR